MFIEGIERFSKFSSLEKEDDLIHENTVSERKFLK